MKKNRVFDAKGFMLVETLLVSLTIAGILVYMYTQFSTINSSYQKLYDYNSTESMYQIGAFRDFLVSYTKGKSVYTSLTAKVITCNDLSLNASDLNYCKKIYTALDPELVILTKGQYTESTVLSKVSGEEKKAIIQKFLKTVEQGSSSNYRLIVLFKDNRVATVQYKFN